MNIIILSPSQPSALSFYTRNIGLITSYDFRISWYRELQIQNSVNFHTYTRVDSLRTKVSTRREAGVGAIPT